VKGLAVAWLFAGCASVQPPPRAPDVGAAKTTLAEAIAAVQRGELQSGQTRLRALISAADFSGLSGDDQHLALVTAAALAVQLSDLTEAKALLRRSTAMEQATAQECEERIDIAFQTRDAPEAIRSLTVLARRWPQALGDLNELYIDRLLWRETSPDVETRLDLLDALHRARWVPLAFSLSPLWRDLTLLLLERKRFDRAREVAADITEPRSLISMRVDKRFDPVVSANPERFDIAKAQGEETRQLKEAAARSPRSLAVVERLLRSLSRAGRYAEAVQLADAAIREATSVGATAYDDADTFLSWIMYQRAHALQGLGRWQEAVNQLADAQLEGDLVSQAINLGTLYCELDRPYDALNVIAHVTQVSPYGRMQLEAVRLAAAVELNDVEATDRALGFLREHWEDAPATLTWALVETRRTDEAANVLIRRLENPGLREEALLALQDYADKPATARMRELHALWKTMAARADVQAAVAKVGRVEHFDIEPVGE